MNTTNHEAQYVTDECDEPFTIEEFLDANQELDPHDIAIIRDLPVGHSYSQGGGAFAEWTIKRVS